MSVDRFRIRPGYMTVIARPPIVVEGMLDRAIQRKALDSPVKPENDKQKKLCRHTKQTLHTT
ncbi:MAG: hypothetical protein WA126_05870 [Thermodesulfovibrionales bacterium]